MTAIAPIPARGDRPSANFGARITSDRFPPSSAAQRRRGRRPRGASAASWQRVGTCRSQRACARRRWRSAHRSPSRICSAMRMCGAVACDVRRGLLQRVDDGRARRAPAERRGDLLLRHERRAGVPGLRDATRAPRWHRLPAAELQARRRHAEPARAEAKKRAQRRRQQRAEPPPVSLRVRQRHAHGAARGQRRHGILDGGACGQEAISALQRLARGLPLPFRWARRRRRQQRRVRAHVFD